VALHNYVNKIIRDPVPQKNLLGNVEITVIRVFFLLNNGRIICHLLACVGLLSKGRIIKQFLARVVLFT
jgi:hypothetical protein